MKKSLIKVFLLLTIGIMFTNCNEQIPAGHKGKIMGKSGFQPEIYPPSKVWVDTTFTTTPEKLFLVQTTTSKYNEPIKVLLKDKLTLKAEVVFRGRINGSDEVINRIFNDLTMDDNVVTTAEVYHVYGKMVILNTAREVISKYNVDEVNQNYQRITVELYKALEPKLKGLPIEISDVTIGNLEYPKIVTTAIEHAKERRMAIEKEQAELEIRLTKVKGREEIAKAEYRIKMLEAKQIADYNEMISKGITKDLIRLKELEMEKIKLERWNGVLPTTTVGSNTPMIFKGK